MASAEQDQWADMAAALQAELAKRVERMREMTVDEVKTLSEAIDSAMWVSVKAAAHDEEAAARLRELANQAAFGG